MTEFRLPDLAELRFDWLWVYDGFVPTTEIWSKELVVPASVFFVVAGHGRIQADNVETDLPQGTAFLAAPGIRRQWFAAGTRLMSVAFRTAWQDGMSLFASGLNLSLPTAKLRALHAATRTLYRSQHGTRRTVGYREAVGNSSCSLLDWSKREAAFHTWFAEYVRTLENLDIHPATRSRPSDERISEILLRLEAWPLARAMDVEELSSGLNIGTRRLEQLLTRDLGLTPHSHLNRRRVETARHVLAATSLPLKQIAHDLGFRHASHFTKWFRKHAGTAPSAYREAGAGDAV